jgi:hypothetical protein
MSLNLVRGELVSRRRVLRNWVGYSACDGEKKTLQLDRSFLIRRGVKVCTLTAAWGLAEL